MQGKENLIPNTTDDIVVFGTKLQGYSHFANNKPCQDAFHSVSFKSKGKSVVITSVADGHGSKKYDLSEIGSSIACKVGVELLKEACFKYKLDSYLIYQSIKSDFPAQMTTKWRSSVLENYKTRKLSDDKSDNVGEILKRYGTTYLFSVIIEDEIIYGKIGDGNIAFISKGADAFEPIEEDLHLVGGATYSLCQQFRVLPQWDIKFRKGFDMLVLSTDGFANSFEHEDYIMSINNIYNQIKEVGSAAIAKSLPEFLEYCSKFGSGDDITILIVYNKKSVGSIHNV